MSFYENEWNISEEDCKDTMKYNVLGNEENAKYVGCLTDHDKALLDEYAFKLFGNSTNYLNIEKEMLVLANQVNTYRCKPIEEDIENSFYKHYPKYLSSKSPEERVTSFKDSIIKIYELMGGDCIGTKEGNELKKALQVAYETPEKYFAEKTKITKNKDAIRDYIKNLGIDGNSNARETFIKALE